MTRALAADAARANTPLARITGEAIEALALARLRNTKTGPGAGHRLRDVAAVRLGEGHAAPPWTLGALELRAVHATRVLVVVRAALAGPAVALLLAEVAVAYETAVRDHRAAVADAVA